MTIYSVDLFCRYDFVERRCSITDGTSGGSGGGGAEVTWGGTISSTANFGMSAFEWLIYELTRTMRWELAITDSSTIVSGH